MNYKQLIFAREFRGLTQSELANQITGLSQSNLSKFEKGLGTLSDELVCKIIDFFGFPKEFYNRKINTTFDNANYRKRATVSKFKIEQFENKCRLIGYIVDEFSESIEWPNFNFPALNVEEGYSPAYIANYIRKHLGLSKSEPLKYIMSLLENNGIIIYEIDALDKFDGLSFISDKGFPIIIINKNASNDRKRFTLAHELCHLCVHNENNFPISSYRDKETEANQFASEFLMPESEIKASLRNLKFSYLGDLKRYWLTSMASIIRKARDLGCIDANKYTNLLIEMSRYGYNKKEPIDVFIDKSACFKNAYYLFKNELSYSLEDFVMYLALPKDVIDDILGFDKIVKLKVL
jgi:Zn-dependent peptidase ImmA (M78 family)/DNA-binding XRE family transcriptional regulator